MADGGTKAMIQTVKEVARSRSGLAALIGVVVLIIGFFIGSSVGRTACVLTFAGAMTYAVVQIRRREPDVDDDVEQEEEHSQSPNGNMKKLLFDDLQSSGGSYVVKEISDEKSVVIPSTRSVHAAPEAPVREEVREFQVGDFFDLDPEVFGTDAEPGSEFRFLLSKVLLAIQEVLFAHSVVFFWSNHEKGTMVLEAKASESSNFMEEKRFSIGGDIVSQVATDGKPKFLGRIQASSESDVIPYYASAEYVKSIVVVPVYYLDGAGDQRPVGVIVVDSKADDAFGHETVCTLGNFTKLVAALVQSYTRKYDLLLDSELLSSIRRMHDRVKSDPTEYAVLAALADESNRLARWECFTVVMFSEEQHGWTLQKVVNKSGALYVGPDQTVDFGNSVAGKVIRTNTVVTVDAGRDDTAPRFAAGEPEGLGGSFVGIPISSINRCYGAVTFESRNPGSIAGAEVETLYRLVESAAAVLEVIYMNDLVKDHVVVDHLTGSTTRKYFLKKVEEEILRASDFETELALVSIAIDGRKEHVERYGQEGFEGIVAQTARIIRTNTRDYDLLGRLDADRIGVLLVNTAASDAYIWAEKVRKMVASQVMTLGDRSVSVTVSAGVCGLTEGMHREELLAGTAQVLSLAIEHGGNLVRVF